jgi:hypothetical protein
MMDIAIKEGTALYDAVKTAAECLKKRDETSEKFQASASFIVAIICADFDMHTPKMMEKDELIAKQQLEIENLKQRVSILNDALRNINLMMTCIGGPLNDNRKGYTRRQLRDFFNIKEQVESVVDVID